MNQALLFLAAAVILVPLAVRVGLGSVLGYLAAGVLIGPWGAGWVTGVESIMHISELGVVLMLFLIGLELEPRRLWAMRRAVFGGGSLQLLACSAIVLPLGLLAGWSKEASLIAALALALSSTAIAVQVMQERKLLATPLGQKGFAILLFQDIAAIPMLALAAVLAPSAAKQIDGMHLAIQFAAIAGVFVIGRYLAYPLLRLIASLGLREIFTAFSLLLVMGIAALMESVGLSMGLGAFLAGVLLAGSEYRHALEADIQPFKGLLLGLFFIAVGMSMDLGLVQTAPLQVAAGLFLIVTLKIIALLVVARVLKVQAKQRGLFAILLSQVGEFAFVVISVSRSAGVLSEQQAGLLTIIAALSMATTPLLLILWQWLCRPSANQRPADVIEDEHSPVIIAGFGRFGQIVGRLLMGVGIRPTVLDYDADTIDTLRKFGFKLYYGDATRLDLLESAGIAHAKILVVAIDDVDRSLALIDLVRQHFPQVQILARARDVQHYIQLQERQVDVVEREMFEGSLRLGRQALQALGWDAYRANEVANTFRRHNLQLLAALKPHQQDSQERIAIARESRLALESMLEDDQRRFENQAHGGDWHER